MTSQTVSAGNIYRLTLTVDEAFLTDPNTVYPVSIDPELSISDNTHGSGAIEDVGIYRGTPNATANWKYMHVGYYDDTYEVGRILVRLTGFINDECYDGLTASQIESAYFYMTEATGKAAATINLHAAAGSTTWTESGATWNNCGVTQGTLIDSVSHGRSVEAKYDITNLIRAWVSTATSPLRGFILSHAEEDTATKGFYSSEYTSNTDYRPYAKITYQEPEVTAEVYITSTQNEVDESATLTLTAVTSPAGQTVTWSSSNSAIASVNSNGVVYGRRAGEVTITATLENGNSDTFKVCVILVDGVYRIRNNLSGYYLGVQNSGYEGALVTQQAESESGISHLSQLWKIRHLGGGRYTIRPLHKVNAAINGYVSGYVISDIGMDDQMIYDMPLTNFSIAYYVNGYVFQSNDYDAYSMVPRGLSGAVNAPVIGTTFTGASSAFRWSLELVSGVFLYNSETYEGILSGSTQFMELDDSRAIFGMIASGNVEATGWSCNYPANAAINTQTGVITPQKRSDVTITASAIIDDEIVEFPINLIIGETICVYSYYDSTLEDDEELLGHIDDAVEFLNHIYSESFNLYFEPGGDPVFYDDAPVDICPITGSDCSNLPNYCGNNCEDHHKNIDRFAAELYSLWLNDSPSKDKIIVMWSNSKENVFCQLAKIDEDQDGSIDIEEHTPRDFLGVVITPETRTIPYPVIQIATVNETSLLQYYQDSYDEKSIMALTLAHEVAHTLGLNEIYSNTYGDDPNLKHSPGYNNDPENPFMCIMRRIEFETADDFYLSVLNEENDGLCEYCSGKLEQYIPTNVYEN